ncbi:MAG: O-antigen ligase family protein [Cyclobacteriaceae bacterium]|nr:O-antigen ligase family protein [Cyclobacteriaceae bacterium]
MQLIFLLLFLAVFALFFTGIEQLVFKGNERFLLYFIVLLFPFYQTLLSLTLLYTGSEVLVTIIRLTKDIVLVIAVVSFVFYRRNLFRTEWSFNRLDLVFVIFYCLALLYMVAPIGSAAFSSKVIYFKGISFMGISYFMGRNSKMNFSKLKGILHTILGITIVAFVTVLLERNFNTHFHSINGYAHYQDVVNDVDPSGHYDLSWTFEASDGNKRFGSVFANPLEFASSMLLSISIAIILFFKSPYRNNRLVYGFFVVVGVLCVYLSYSRAALGAVFGMLVLIALLFRYYKLIYLGLFLFCVSIVYLMYFAHEDTRYFVIDTITFQESSAVGHVIEWFLAAESMIENPLGIGLATSGNAGGVDSELKIGGENQFLIIGVQLGFLGMFLYLYLVYLSIKMPLAVYRHSHSVWEQVAPFIASTTKFGLILPMFTSNIEINLYISTVSWWFVGYSLSKYNGKT